MTCLRHPARIGLLLSLLLLPLPAQADGPPPSLLLRGDAAAVAELQPVLAGLAAEGLIPATDPVATAPAVQGCPERDFLAHYDCLREDLMAAMQEQPAAGGTLVVLWLDRSQPMAADAPPGWVQVICLGAGGLGRRAHHLGFDTAELAAQTPAGHRARWNLLNCAASAARAH